MTRTEALEAFFTAVDAHMPHDALIGRAAIRNAGIEYAHAAVDEVLARWVRSVDERHLLDGVEVSPQPQPEGLRQDAPRPRLVSDLTDTFDREYDGERQ